MKKIIIFNKKMKISDMGEFGFIKKLAGQTKNSRDVVLGIGDDAAVIRYTKEKYLLLATDMLIEDVHFKISPASARPRTSTAFEIGYKALAVNISDIAAMGGIPKYALISVGLPSNLSLKFALQIYRGVCSLAGKYKIDIVGGDTDSSAKLVINIALTGEVEKKYLVTRKGAGPGDLIFVTGALGGSIYSKHLKFTPRLKEARLIVSHLKPSAMIDISDGLSNDLTRIMEASRVGAVIYEKQIPVSRNGLKSARAKKIKPVEAALHDGEDFELLFTTTKTAAGKMTLSGQIKIKGVDVPIHCIGQITNTGSGLKIVGEDNRARVLRPKGYQHFHSNCLS